MQATERGCASQCLPARDLHKKKYNTAMSSASSAPLDAEAMRTLLRSMGVDKYEPRVLHQLLEFMQSYTTEIFEDSALYAEHAGRAGQIECEDVWLSARLKAAAAQQHAPQLMEQMARAVNKKPLGKPTVPNIQLPNPKLCLVEENWQLAPPPRPPPAGAGGAAGAAALQGSSSVGGAGGGRGRAGGPAAPSGLTDDGRVAFSLPARSASASAQQRLPAAMQTD